MDFGALYIRIGTAEPLNQQLAPSPAPASKPNRTERDK